MGPEVFWICPWPCPSTATPTACPVTPAKMGVEGPSEGRCVSRVQTRIIPRKCFTSSTMIGQVDRLVVHRVQARSSVSRVSIPQRQCPTSRCDVEPAVEPPDISPVQPGRPDYPAFCLDTCLFNCTKLAPKFEAASPARRGRWSAPESEGGVPPVLMH